MLARAHGVRGRPRSSAVEVFRARGSAHGIESSVSSSIQIRFARIGAQESESITLAPTDFFERRDPALDVHGFDLRDAVPRFDHAREYLDVDAAELRWTVLTVTGAADGYTIRTQFMQGGAGWMSHRIDADGAEELIHVARLDGGREHVIKTTKPTGGAWMVIGNAFPAGGVDADLVELGRYYGPLGIQPALDRRSFAWVE